MRKKIDHAFGLEMRQGVARGEILQSYTFVNYSLYSATVVCRGEPPPGRGGVKEFGKSSGFTD